MRRPLPFFSLIVFILSACTSPSSSLTSSSTSQPNEEDIAYQTFWQTTELHFSLSIEPEVLRYVETYGQEKNDVYNDMYFPVTMSLSMHGTTYTLNNVGIRQKGNIFSRGPFLGEDGDLISPFHFRLSFDQLFDDPFYEPLGLQKTWRSGEEAYETQQKRRLFGMKSIEFKWNRSNDPSLINQVYASRFFKQAEVLSPSSTLGHITFNLGEQIVDAGLYFINEAVDQRFLDRHFSGQAAQGDLYKALYPVNLYLPDMTYFNLSTNTYVFHEWMVGIEDTFNGYHPTYDLKTNRTTSKHEPLMQLIKTLYSIRLYSESERLDRLASVVDIPSFLRYASASYLVGNPDDMRNNTNNTYIYFHGETQKAYFIPYDNDWSLGVTWDPALTEWTSTKSPYSPLDSFGGTIRNPLYWLTIFPSDSSTLSQFFPLLTSLQDAYTEQLESLMNHLFYTPEAYTALFNAYANQYPAIEPNVANPSTFDSIDAFSSHFLGIMTTLQITLSS